MDKSKIIILSVKLFFVQNAKTFLCIFAKYGKNT